MYSETMIKVSGTCLLVYTTLTCGHSLVEIMTVENWQMGIILENWIHAHNLNVTFLIKTKILQENESLIKG